METKTISQEQKNLEIYNLLKSVPKNATKEFTTGRFDGTDTNPMWRIKKLTEIFGPAGKGWWVEVLRTWTEDDNNNLMCFYEVALRVKFPGETEWSAPIIGTGGNSITKLKDEAYKGAFTDALSIACKSLGMCADIWYSADKEEQLAVDKTSKYAEMYKDGKADQRAGEMNASSFPGASGSNRRPSLDPSNTQLWKQSITIAASAGNDLKALRERIEKKYYITNENFNRLMRESGKIS